MNLADLFPSTLDEQGLILVMAEFTLLILTVVGIAIYIFARLSKKDRLKREKDVNTRRELRP